MSQIASIAAKLTYNGAVNLVGTIEHPDPDQPDALNGGQRLFTGLGKWTTIAAKGVESHLISLGLIERVWTGTYWHQLREERHKNFRCRITPLGREVATYAKAHWDDLVGTFKDGRRR